MLTCTKADLRKWEACYDDAAIDAAWAKHIGKPEASALDFLRADLPARDVLWVVLREELIPAPILHELACRFAESAIGLARSGPDPRSIAAIAAKRAWLCGEITDAQLAAAMAAAWAAAWAAAMAAARDAAWAAAWAAARAAAWAAARAAACAAARDAAWAAAWAAHVQIVLAMLTEADK
jgi:hypothetical protein